MRPTAPSAAATITAPTTSRNFFSNMACITPFIRTTAGVEAAAS
jgi:hypothetical protein